MVKTQIQLPEHLYREAKRIAADYEMSFAEVVRRSLERTLPAYPPRTSAEWRLPEPIHLELRCPIDDDEWTLLGNDPDYRPRHLPWSFFLRVRFDSGGAEDAQAGGGMGV